MPPRTCKRCSPRHPQVPTSVSPHASLGSPHTPFAMGICHHRHPVTVRKTQGRSYGPGSIVDGRDDIDKVGQSNYHGDPSAALLEVLDPEQNVAFNDHYLDVPIDLLQILFICTANSLDTISPPLLDRCEVIQLSGYTQDEKLHIARRFLLPKQFTQNGLSEPHVQLTEPALLKTVMHYTWEVGVRSLERSIGGIVVRFKAVKWAVHVDAQGLAPSSLPTPLPASEPSDALAKPSKDGAVGYNPIVEADELEKILGLSRYVGEDREREAWHGVVWGLVASRRRAATQCAITPSQHSVQAPIVPQHSVDATRDPTATSTQHGMQGLP